MSETEKQKWVNDHILRYQELGSEELIDMLSTIVSLYRQNEKCKSSVASLYVLNNSIECVEGFLETYHILLEEEQIRNFVWNFQG